MKTIVLATDGSPSAQEATGVAIELASASDADLRVVSVWRVPVYDYGYVPAQIGQELVDALRTGAEAAVAQAVAAAITAGVTVSTEVREGSPSEEICAAAERFDADMIVIGAHGWNAMKRLLFGSVSSAVLHHAPCPVLIVRAQADERPREHAGVTTDAAA